MDRARARMRWRLVGARAMFFGTVALGVATIAAPVAQACAACGCGDATLTLMGTEQPFAARVRLSADVTYRTQTVGADLARLHVDEWRLVLGASWFPVDWLAVGASVPLVWRTTMWPGNPSRQAWGLGDAEIRARAIVVRPRLGGHMLALVVGLRAPTAPVLHDQYGALRAEAQPGLGSFAPIAGAQYGWYGDPWSVVASSVVTLPIGEGNGGIALGPSLRTGAALQWQPLAQLAFKLGVDTRLDSVAREHGQRDEDSGGFIGYLSPDVLWSPIADLLVSVGLRVPVVNALRGHQTEGVYVTTAVTVDL